MTSRALVAVAIASLLAVASPARAAIQLIPVASGLSNPLFVGHAGDGSNRLFIVERGGTIRVLQPGSSSPTLFLDIHTKVATAGGEQGLLGLAFHPSYAINRRFFVYYSRIADGAEVIAEYAASASNPDVADPTETVLLTIPHPTFQNHNGGMLAFAPDGTPFLYIGVGDGGGGFDSQFNNAQNKDVLLGKMLRIDVDRPDTVNGTLYSSPADNPFVGQPGRDEIFAYGFRNPWRWSFDRLTRQQWVADVGQGGAPYGAREEVDTPIVNGGNYGWRVFEGDQCTGQDPTLCNTPSNYIFPIFQYDHATNGRCSITGGYVYRGTMGAVPNGTYLYGDYCSGEIFQWNGSAQSLLLDTTLNISSFGEDESGEVYVVGLGGTVSRIASTSPPPTCTYAISPTKMTFGASGGNDSVTVTAPAGCGWNAQSNVTWITITGGASGSGNGTVMYRVEPYTGKPRNRNGSATIAGQTFSVKQSR
jgi:glucose/arabinose dehydrogenase